MLDAEFLMKSILKALPYLCICMVRECSQLNWELVKELGFLLLHTDFLLHFSFCTAFSEIWTLDGCYSTTTRRCEAFTEAGRKVYKDGGTPGSTG